MLNIYLNCKILSNEIDVFKKIYSNSINYFEFNNLDHLVFQLKNLLLDEKNYALDIEKKKILQNNSWQNTANMTEKIYKIFDNS